MENILQQIDRKKNELIEIKSVVSSRENIGDIKKILGWSDQPGCFLESVKEDYELYNSNPSFIQIVNDILKEIKLENVIGRTERSGQGAFTLSHVIPDRFDRLESFVGYIKPYSIISKVAFCGDNVVLIGSNGSGKTTLATKLKKIVKRKSGIVIMAQRLLFLPKIENIPSFSTAEELYKKFDSEIPDYKKDMRIDTIWGRTILQDGYIGDEFKNVIGFLIAEKISRLIDNDSKNHGSNSENKALSGKTKLDDAFDVWADLFPNVELALSGSGNIVVKNKRGEEYGGNSLSDGEKAALYLIGKVLLAPEISLIVIDEPEAHLHKVITVALWNILEDRRNDCTFVYVTHDIDFAVTRNARKIWVKNFNFPDDWDLVQLKEHEIPEPLYLKLLGSKRKILFCEGNRGGWDELLYSALFPECLVEPVGGCSNVRAYVKAMKSNPNYNYDCFGVIDRDLLSESEIEELESKNIFVIRVSEVENVFLLPEILKDFAASKDEEIDFMKMESEILEKLKKEKNKILNNAVPTLATKIFSKVCFEKITTLEDVKEKSNSFNDQSLNLLKESINRLNSVFNEALSRMDYGKSINVLYNKDLISVVKKYFNRKDANIFRKQIIKFLSSNEVCRHKVISRLGLDKLKTKVTTV